MLDINPIVNLSRGVINCDTTITEAVELAVSEKFLGSVKLSHSLEVEEGLESWANCDEKEAALLSFLNLVIAAALPIPDNHLERLRLHKPRLLDDSVASDPVPKIFKFGEKLLRERGRNSAAASLQVKLATWLRKNENPELAIEIYQSARETFWAEGMIIQAAICDKLMGISYSSLKEHEAAIDLYQRARLVFRTHDADVEAARCDYNLGNQYMALHQFEKVSGHYQAAREIFASVAFLKLELYIMPRALSRYMSR